MLVSEEPSKEPESSNSRIYNLLKSVKVNNFVNSIPIKNLLLLFVHISQKARNKMKSFFSRRPKIVRWLPDELTFDKQL
jgi:hypothetical protein